MRVGIIYRLAVILALLELNVTMLAAQESAALESLRRSYSAATDSLDALSARRDSLSGRMEKISAEVARLKKGVAGDVFSPVEQYRLGESLRAGKSLADSLDRLSIALNALERRAVAARTALYRGLNARIESLESGRSSRSKGALAAQLESLKHERAALSARLEKEKPAVGTVPDLTATLRVEPDDSPDQVRDKADYAADLATRVQRGLGLVQAEIKRVRDESAVRRRTGEFTQEVALFDEGLTLRRTETHGSVEAAASPADKSADGGAGETVRGGFDDLLGFGLKGESTTTVPDGVSGAGLLDREMYDPDRERILQGGIESLSPGEIEALLSRLMARRDSLTHDLENLRRLEQSLRSQAGKLGIDREGTGRK